MRCGHFDDAAKEYVIETPATPLPWINYLGNEDFFSPISNTGGGYSFYKDDKLRRITRYRYNNVPADNGSRCYYLSLMDSDADDAKPVETWSPTFLPCKTPLDSYWTELLSTYRADWNDCLNLNCFSNTPGESFQTVENNDTGVAESVFIGGMFVLYGGQYADIIEHYGKLTGMDDANVTKEAANIRAEIGQVSEAVKTAGWDGEWFVRAYDAYSRKVGTHEDTEGQIYIEPQGMCVMAGIGLDDGKAQQALKSVKDRLTCDWGTAILAPAYSTYRIELGEISSYPRGYKENGGILCHNNPWISIANALAGNDDETFAVYQRNCPAYVEDKSDIRKVEPYAYCQMAAGPESPTPGEGKNSWLTGTAAWTFVDVSQYLLGVRPTLDGLAIEPHLPAEFTNLTVTRVFRGVTYTIAMKRTGERSVAVNGEKIDGDTVPVPTDTTKPINVTVTF